MFFLEAHPNFYSKQYFNNMKGHQYGFDKVVYTEYTFIDVDGGRLHVFISPSYKYQWIFYFPDKPYFIQKISSTYENGPKWMQDIIKKTEIVLKDSGSH